jgi:hypothetical protein
MNKIEAIIRDIKRNREKLIARMGLEEYLEMLLFFEQQLKRQEMN